MYICSIEIVTISLTKIKISEFKEFPLKKIRGLEEKFKKYDADKDHALNIEELKKLMEGLGEPQTHRFGAEF